MPIELARVRSSVDGTMLESGNWLRSSWGIRSSLMPMFKIYVGNLDQRVKIEQIRELFAPFATIEDAVLATDTKTGKPKGFAIVMVRDPEIGRAAVKATQGKRLLGKTLTINEVVKKGKAAAKAAKEVRQGPFGPHFNRQSTGRAGGGGGGGFRPSGGVRRGMNRGPRGPALGGGSSGGVGGGYRPTGSDGGSSPGFRSGLGGAGGFSRGADLPGAPRARPSEGRPGDIPPRRPADEDPRA
jgi:hypothetical protein